MSTDLRVIDPEPASQQDLTELGALLAGTGYTTLETRALIGQIQQASAQVALNVTPALLEQVRRIQEARIMEVVAQIRSLPHTLGYLHREQVIRIVQNVALRPHRQ
jgi:hypothetical protein